MCLRPENVGESYLYVPLFLWLRQSLTGFLAAVLVLGFKGCATMPTHIYLSIVVIIAFSSFF